MTMLQWEWVEKDTAPLMAQYRVNGRAASLAGATVTLELYDIKNGELEVEDLPVSIVDAATGLVSFSPSQDVGDPANIPAGKYYARFKIVDALDVEMKRPADKRTFSIVVHQDIG